MGQLILSHLKISNLRTCNAMVWRGLRGSGVRNSPHRAIVFGCRYHSWRFVLTHMNFQTSQAEPFEIWCMRLRQSKKQRMKLNIGFKKKKLLILLHTRASLVLNSLGQILSVCLYSFLTGLLKSNKRPVIPHTHSHFVHSLYTFI